MVSCKGNSHPGNFNGIHQNSSNTINKSELPNKVQNLQNLTVYPADLPAPDTVVLKRAVTFKSTKHVFINGYIGSAAVDNKNRVYIAAGKPNAAQAIYVFKPNGDYLTTIGRMGKGAGEFMTISSLKIRNKKLYVYDRFQRRISVYSLKNFKLVNDFKIRRDSIISNGTLNSYKLGLHIFIQKNGAFLKDFISVGPKNNKDSILYYHLSKKGEILPGKVLALKEPYTYQTGMKLNSKGYAILPFTMPFNRSSLIAMSNKGFIFTSWTNYFLIKIYDANGNYQRAIYYRYKNSPLSLTNNFIDRNQKQFLTNKNTPDTWPALHTMFFDDQNRLWVFTITNSKTHYKGWVLNKYGKLLARFNWPGRRATNEPGRKPNLIVENGYLYKTEVNVEKGLNQVVKYKIQFRKNK
jgi:hypothetical protein